MADSLIINELANLFGAEFNLEKYLKAHEEMSHEQILQINGSTELGVKMGLNCTLVQGDPLNFKITTPEDLINFKNILDNRK